ncbi:mitotic checkpoint serine:threonine protein [Echinococcus multilocularis]|uniref:Mitotic checkpoint serine:threonine protein n=1 Tax=Echinococcus multilocularis TaxID=6211 RepID=A0A068Y2N6_ECHMU|nr:mitotic checkpoint serine:threonine protein [Echinococcus multilocularis]
MVRKNCNSIADYGPSSLCRYIRWVEETYPSLGAASELRSILYRCVKETCGLEGVHNHPIYVDTWLKLVNYCDAPTELFNLLFHKGVGTLSAKFYISWMEHIQHLPEKVSTQPLKKWARLASILAHGLRAGAQPIVLLEDRAENLVELVRHAERLAEEERCFDDLSAHRRHAPQPTSGGNGERKALASLQTITSTDPVTGESSIVPSVRTAHALHPEQQGLRSVGAKSQLLSQSQKPSTVLKIYRDASSPTDLPNLPSMPFGASDLGKSLSRLAEPMALWNVENAKQPTIRLDRRTASMSVSASQPRALAIYRDPPEEIIRASGSSSRAPLPSTSTRPRGLRVVSKEDRHNQQQDSFLYSFDCLKSALLAKQMPGTREAVEAVEDSEFNVEFFCDVDALYSHREETCFEMNRLLKDVQPSHGVEDCFSLNLDDPHSKALIREIESIISGAHLEEEEEAETRPAKRNDYSNLIRTLEGVIGKAETNGHAREEETI